MNKKNSYFINFLNNILTLKKSDDGEMNFTILGITTFTLLVSTLGEWFDVYGAENYV